MVDLKSAVYISPKGSGSIPVMNFPQRGEELIVGGVHRNLVRFDGYDDSGKVCWWPHHAFMSVDEMNAEIESLL
jgi:hypothetical protein